MAEVTIADTKAAAKIPTGVRIVAMGLRAVFIVCLAAITVRVSLPQNETIWTAYDTPTDLVRMALGFAVCLWVAVQLFKLPKDVQSNWTWLYCGFAAVPFAMICLYFIW
jgi:hypothetical protein